MPISIGIPFYNCERFLPDAIRSVFAQTYQDWELILIDDGSTDQSLEIARSIDDPRVRVFSDGKNLRQATRRNQANEQAKYDLIAVMDADDIMFPKRLETQHELLQNPNIQLVSSGQCTISDHNQIKSLRNCSGIYDISPRGILSYRHRLMHPAIIARKQWFLDHPYDNNILHGDDFELFLRCTIDRSLTNATVKIVDAPLLFYREDSLQTLRKLKIGQRDIRYTFAKHCLELGWRVDMVYSMVWALRNCVYRTAAILGILPFVKRLKDKPIHDKDYLQELNKELQTVLQTPVSGMDEYLKQHSCISNNNKVLT
jgi:glycosyltransferase involved in cell wall biosynthesis